MWHDPDDRLRKAVERFEEDDVESAWRMLRSLERKGVESPRIDLYLGHCHLESNRPAAAIRRYRRAAARAPRRPEPWIGLGLAFGRLGRLRRARSAFRRAARLAPELEEAHCQLVHCHVLLGEMDDALRVARKVEALDPACPHLHRHIAVGHDLAGRTEEALAAWRRVQARDPAYPELATGLGRCYARLRRGTEARAAYLRAVEADPEDGAAWLGLGDLAALEGRPEEALEHHRAALSADPSDEDARLRVVEDLLGQGRPAEALDALEPLRRGAEAVDPLDGAERSEVVGLEARARRGLGQRAQALVLLRIEVAARPRDATAWRALGEHLLADGRRRAALRVLRKSVKLETRGVRRVTATPASVGPLELPGGTGGRAGDEGVRLLARALARTGRRKQAVAVLARATRHHPHGIELWIDLAAALLARGRDAAADRALLRGLSWNGESAPLWAGAAELALDRGDLAEARTRLRAALRRDRRLPAALGLLTRWWASRASSSPPGSSRAVWARASHAARAAARVLPGGDEAVRTHGLALLRLGRPAEALVPLRRYVLAAPGDPEGYALLAEVYDALGQTAVAGSQRGIAKAVGRPRAVIAQGAPA